MNIQKIQLTIVTISILLSASSAFSSEEDSFYGGVILGSSNFKDNRFDESNHALGFQLGWRFNALLGVELSYIDHQEIDSGVLGQISPEPKVTSLSAVLRYPITNKIEIFGRAGLANLRVGVDSSGPFTQARSFTENTGTYGLGIGYRLGKNWKMRVAYDRTKLDLGFIRGGGIFGNSSGNLDVGSISFLRDF